MNYKRETYKEVEELGYKTFNQLILRQRIPRVNAIGKFVLDRIYYKVYETEQIYTLQELKQLGLKPVDEHDYIQYNFSNGNVKRYYRISNTKNSWYKE